MTFCLLCDSIDFSLDIIEDEEYYKLFPDQDEFEVLDRSVVNYHPTIGDVRKAANSCELCTWILSIIDDQWQSKDVTTANCQPILMVINYKKDGKFRVRSSPEKYERIDVFMLFSGNNNPIALQVGANYSEWACSLVGKIY